jgi:hypothetical protein
LDDTLLTAAAFTDFVGGFTGGKPTASGPVNAVTTLIGVTASAPVTIAAGAGWGGGITTNFPATGNDVTYTFTLAPKSGYTFVGATPSDWDSIIVLTNVPNGTASCVAGTDDTIDVTLSWAL